MRIISILSTIGAWIQGLGMFTRPDRVLIRMPTSGFGWILPLSPVRLHVGRVMSSYHSETLQKKVVNTLSALVGLLDCRRGRSYNAFVRPLISRLLGGLRRPMRYQCPSLVPKEQCTHHRSTLARHWVGLPRHHCCPLEAHV